MMHYKKSVSKIINMVVKTVKFQLLLLIRGSLQQSRWNKVVGRMA